MVYEFTRNSRQSHAASIANLLPVSHIRCGEPASVLTFNWGSPMHNSVRRLRPFALFVFCASTLAEPVFAAGGPAAPLGRQNQSRKPGTVTVMFLAQPQDTNVSAVINSGRGVLVQLRDSQGHLLGRQDVTISIGANPPGTGTLTGTLTRATNILGVARFNDLKIDWLGTGYTLVATANLSGGTVSTTSAAFNELRVGDACLGPDTPACEGTCPDTDGDGLSDAWEKAGGVDLNGDGLITDSTHDLLLPGADPNQPDVFVQYDWLDYGSPGNACTVDTDCSGLGAGHNGETCTGPQLIPAAPASCRYACTVNSDCTSRSAFPGDTSHSEEICRANSCVHTHDPSVTAPNALQATVDSFAAHGINLHLIRGQAQPHSTVISMRLLSDPQYPDNVMTDSCEGGSLASGDAGPGKYAESFYDLKKQSSLDKLDIAYHYALFSHYSGCDTKAHCGSGTCLQSLNPNGSPKNAINAAESGLAEISGNDFIVSLGSRVQDLGYSMGTIDTGGTFMHELGHNLGLHHGGGIDTACHDDSQCKAGVSCVQVGFPPVGNFCVQSDDTNWKPNYLTAMNYRFQFAGIEQAAAVGSSQPISCSADSDCPSSNYCFVAPSRSGVCSRLDFSAQTLPTGGNTPGVLEERNTDGYPGLNEPAGLGSGTADLTSYYQYDPVTQQCIVPAVIAPADGPLDFDGDGATTTTNATADLNGVDHLCGTIFARLTGATDWPELSGINFNYGFQCTAFGGPGGDIAVRRGASASARSMRGTPPIRYFSGGELSPQMALDAHLLFPIRSVKIAIHPGCSVPALTPGQPGVVNVALFGDKTFDVKQVDLASLKFAGAAPLSTSIRDVDGDGGANLLITFDMAKLNLSSHSAIGRLSGWMKNSQVFAGELQIHVVSNLAEENSACR